MSDRAEHEDQMRTTPDADAAFYTELGPGRFASTPATAGPWSPETQHGGPPSALVGRAMAARLPRPGLRIARVTVEIPRPVPVADLEVETELVRSGSRTALIGARITAGGQVVLLARSWAVAAAPADSPTLRPQPPPPPLPGPQPWRGMPGAHIDGYLSAMEWRFAAGGGFDVPGPASAWARARLPLVAGERDTPLIRALTLADSCWGIAFELDHVRQMVINTDVTLALHRDPVGEWLCIRSATSASPQGSGLACGQVADADGDCGQVLQTLFIAGRAPA